MVLHRQAALAALLLLGLAGCHAGNSGTLANKPEGPQARDNITVDRFIAKHNRDAVAVRSLTASPGIEATIDKGQKGEKTGHLNGQMAFERSKNFRLELTAGLRSPVADIGSNDKEFWFWVSADKKDNTIYVCDHDRIVDSQLAVTFQPEWIIEAMGLHEFSEREAATLHSRPGQGDMDGTIILTQIKKDPRSRENLLTKETTVDVITGHIIEHKLYAGSDKKTLLARATISQYKGFKFPPTDAEPSGFQVDLPLTFRLDWIEEKFSMSVTMSQVALNQPINPDARAARFSEPTTIKNASRVDLGRQGIAQAGGVGSAGPSRLYESMPQPRSGASIELGQPDSSVTDGDGSYRKAGVAPPPMPAPSSTDAQPDTMSSLGVVGAPLPQGSDSAPAPAPAAATGRRSRFRIGQ